jgi:DNA-binding response OmpR family regulator
MKRILYADDEAKYRRLVKLFLSNQGYEVITVDDGEQVIDEFFKQNDFDLVILDVMMPNVDGIEACKAIREYSTIPIIMLTALGDVKDEIKGLEIGADDYIAKPFSNEKLVARVNSLLRRTQINERTQFESEGIMFDDVLLQVSYDDHQYDLTLKEYKLMKALILNKNQVLSRSQLLDLVWGFDYEGDPRTLDTHIKSLRAKSGRVGERIKTVRGKGYYYQGAQDDK